MKKNILFLFAIIFAMTTAAYADYYTWTDKDGTTHITDYPPPKDAQRQDVKIYKGDNSGEETPDVGQTGKKPEILLFTKNECPVCNKAREFLTSQNLVFTEYNMDTDEKAVAKRQEFDESSDVPFAVINRTQVYGFTEAVYNRALKAIP